MSTPTSPISTLTPTQIRLNIEAENARNIVKVPEIIEELHERLAVLYSELIAEGYDKVDAEQRALVGPAELTDVVVRDATTWEDPTPFQRFLVKLGFQVTRKPLRDKEIRPLATWKVAVTKTSDRQRYVDLHIGADDGALYMRRNYGEIVAIDFEYLKQACNYKQASQLLDEVNDRIDSILSHREHLVYMAELNAAAEVARAENDRLRAELEADRESTNEN
jgi:hypothetical protein